MKLSLDGVQECRSTSVSLDVYSVQMKNCRQIYPLKIIRPLNKFHVPYKPQLQDILRDLEQTHCIIHCFIGDNPKRAIIREALNHASNYACEYCVSRAERFIEDKIKNHEEKKKNDQVIRKFEIQIHELRNTAGSSSALKKQDEQIQVLNGLIKDLKKQNSKLMKTHAHSVWPQSTSNGRPRTQEEILSIVERLEGSERSQLTADDVKGFVGRSLLLDVPGFPFVTGVTVEYMHLACLGVVKR